MYLQVQELYKGALGKLQQLHPFLVMQGTLGEGDGRIRMEVEKEAVRRKNLGSQLKSLLDRQLEVTFSPTLVRSRSILKAIDWLFIQVYAGFFSQVLRREQRVQQRVHSVFMAHLTESIRLEAKRYHSDQASCKQHQHM